MNQKLQQIPVKVVPADEETRLSLYEVHKKVYPRHVSGWWANWRIALVVLTQMVFYGTLWLRWNGRQAVLFDLAARKFHLFGLTLWPQDLIYLAGLLVVCAVGLFWWTTIAGRLWCGYACPQTVYTQIFLWIEQWVEGDRNARMKLDKGPNDARKIRLKLTKHGLWIALSVWTGFTFVGYFTPAQELWRDLWSVAVGPWALFWILFYGFATYGNAGWMREQVCKHMCPYARFQSVMFDRDTLVISYDAARGEPRGSRSKKTDYQAAGLGACVDCTLCVQVCPTGIDIRDGLQYECIGCAACIDACDQVMDKMGYPKGLIRYTTENALEGRYPEERILSRLWRPRVIGYSVLLLVVGTLTLVTLALREPLKVNVIRDRNALARETDDGWVENSYRLQIMNTDERAHPVAIEVEGLPAGTRVVVDDGQSLDLPSASSRAVPVRVQADPADLKPGGTAFHFVVRSRDEAALRTEEKTTFIQR